MDVYIYSDLSDDVSKELMSRGIHIGREKLKWWQFVMEDKAPDNMIDVSGYRIVQVVGDMDDFDVHRLGMLKAEYPVLNRSMLKTLDLETVGKANYIDTPTMSWYTSPRSLSF